MSELQVSKTSPLPLYYQVREILRKEIEQNKLGAGAPISPESELITRFGVSRTTVRKALDDLVASGLIHREQGHGTFVRGRVIEQELAALTGFVEDMVELGYRPSARVIKVASVPSDERVAQKLNLSVGEEVTYIERVRLANEQPISLDVTWLPAHLGKQVVNENLAAYPIFSLLEDKYRVSLAYADYRLEAALANPDVANALEMQVGAPIFLVERVAFSTSGEPVDYERLHYRGDCIRFSMRLKRKHPPWRLEDMLSTTEKEGLTSASSRGGTRELESSESG